MWSRKVFVVAGLILMLGVGPALAQERLAGQWWRMPDVAAKMRISKQEQEKLDELYLANRRNLFDQRALIEKERLALEEAMTAEHLDEAKVREQFKRIEKVRADLAEERFQYYLNLRKILGPERYRQFMQSRKNYRQDDRRSSRSKWWEYFRR